MIVPGATLKAPRYYHTSAVIGNYLYVVGGVTGALQSSVERAAILADGSLGPFMAVSGVTLVTARQNHTSAIVGNYLYVLGGSNGSVLNSVERAPISPDGSLGTFATVQVTPTVSLTLAFTRTAHTSAVVGGDLYVLGGTNSPVGTSINVERAKINPDSSLSAFGSVSPGISLMMGRCYHASIVVGSSLYAIGGYCGNGTEGAMIDKNGLLDSFANGPSVPLGPGRYLHTLTVVGNYLYAIGGIAGTAVNSVDRAPLGSVAP